MYWGKFPEYEHLRSNMEISQEVSWLAGSGLMLRVKETLSSTDFSLLVIMAIKHQATFQ